MPERTEALSLGLAAFSALVGAPVAAAERCGWGFENETALLTLANGQHLIVQLLSSRARAAQTLRLAGELPARLQAAGVVAPRQLAADASASPPYAIREYLPGTPAASRMNTLDGATRVAEAMGALLPGLAGLATHGIELDATWARPDTLAAHARDMLARCAPLLAPGDAEVLETTIVALPAQFAGRVAGFAHGDFCPVNVLLAGDEVAALLDFEFARLADALFDAAWWGWVVRYHHPERWIAAWPALLAAGGIVPDAANAARIRSLHLLRCLEMLDDHAHSRVAGQASMWAERLHATVGWD